MSKKGYVTFGAQMGDTTSDVVVSPQIMELRRLLDKYCDYPYAEGIDEFAPILRVDGDIWYWEFEGLEKLRLMRQRRYITVDIGMPKSRWQNVSAISIREYLIKNMKLAFEAFVKKLQKEHIQVNDKKLFEDFSKVQEEYLRDFMDKT